MNQLFVYIHKAIIFEQTCVIAYFQPVFSFIGFLERDLKLGDHIRSTLWVIAFGNIRGNACAASLYLIADALLPF